MKEKGNVAYDKAFDLAKSIVHLYKNLTETKKEYVLSKQLLRSGTSIGANLAEAIGAFSKADFSYKISISYKECLETKYWLSLLHETNFLSKDLFSKYYSNADEIGKILFATLKTTKLKN